MSNNKSTRLVEITNPLTWGDELYSTIHDLNDTEEHFDCGDKVSSLRDKATMYLLNCDIICYHCTRLTKRDICNIVQNGLSVLVPGVHRQRIYEQAIFCKFDEKALKKIQSFNYHSEEDCTRNGRLYFTYFVPEVDDTGCRGFFKYYGGEIAYHMLNGDCDMLDKLSRTSKPYLIKFRVAYANIPHNWIIDNMVKVCDPNWVGNCGDGSINDGIAPEDILEIIPRGAD